MLLVGSSRILTNRFLSLLQPSICPTKGSWRLLTSQTLPPDVDNIFKRAKASFDKQEYKQTLRTLIKIPKDHRNHPDVLRLRARVLCCVHSIGRFPGTEGTLLFPQFSRPEIYDPTGSDDEDQDIEDVTEEVLHDGFSSEETPLSALSKRLYEPFSQENTETNRVISPEKEAESIYYKAVAHYVSGEWKKAQKLFGIIAEVIPEAQLKRGHAYLLQGEPEKAIRAYNKVLGDQRNSSPSKSEAYAGIACSYLEQGMLEEAGKAFQQSSESGNRDITANNVLAWLVYRLPQIVFKAQREGVSPCFSFHSHKAFQNLFLKLNRPTDVSVRENPENELIYAQILMNKIQEIVPKIELKRLFVAEVLSKIVGFQDYRKLPADKRKISIPHDNELVTYKIETISLSDNIFATTLLPIDTTQYPPIFIFRGTSTEMSAPGSVVSMYNNIDPEGVAKAFFEKNKPMIRQWLQKTHKQTGHKIQLVGYSQGAALVAMTAAAFPTLIHDNPKFPSITLNAAASDEETSRLWKGSSTKPALIQYLVRGDIVSRLGYELIGDVYEIQFNMLSAGVNPHFLLTFAHPNWSCFHLNTESENRALTRKIISILSSSTLGRELFSHFSEGYLGMALRVANKANTLLNHENTSTLLSYVGPIASQGAHLATRYMFNALVESLKSLARGR